MVLNSGAFFCVPYCVLDGRGDVDLVGSLWPLGVAENYPLEQGQAQAIPSPLSKGLRGVARLSGTAHTEKVRPTNLVGPYLQARPSGFATFHA